MALLKQPELVHIKPSTGLAALNLGDLWPYRELVLFMIWRDIKVRYKQTFLGAAWAVIQPGLTMLVFNFVFGTVAKVPTDGVPYPIFSYTALLPWGLFPTALDTAPIAAADAGHCAGHCALAFRHQREVPGRQLCASVPDSVLALSHPGSV